MGIYIALGSNLPHRKRSPQQVIGAALAELPRRGVRIAAVSRYYSSPAWPVPSDPEYVNAVARVETELHPRSLLDVLQAVEARFGRRRSGPNAPRTLDLDIVDFEGLIFDEDGLTLPHPRAHQRAFVLLPLRDIAPDWVEPRTGERLPDLIAALARDVAGACKPVSGEPL